MVRALVTGASGYIGSRLVRELHARGVEVGCVVRDPRRVSFDPAVKVHRADMLDPSSLSAIDEGYTTAYYLVHSMGRGGDADYARLTHASLRRPGSTQIRLRTRTPGGPCRPCPPRLPGRPR